VQDGFRAGGDPQHVRQLRDIALHEGLARAQGLDRTHVRQAQVVGVCQLAAQMRADVACGTCDQQRFHRLDSLTVIGSVRA
jgi:hypothetical protein